VLCCTVSVSVLRVATCSDQRCLLPPQGNGDSGRRKIFYQKELTQYSRQVASDMVVRDGQVSSLLSSSDAILSEGRELDALFAQMLAQRLGEEGDEAAALEAGPAAGAAGEEPQPGVLESEASLDGINWKGVH
jgi:hypothetical protein